MAEKYTITGPTKRQYGTDHVCYTAIDNQTRLDILLFYDALRNPLPSKAEVLMIVEYAFANRSIPSGYEDRWMYYQAM